MDLPKTWTWHDDDAFAINVPFDIRGFVGMARSTIVRLNSDEVCDTDSPVTAAQKRLAELPDETALNANRDKGWKLTIRDQRIIQVDGIDAAWQAISWGRQGGVPGHLDTICYLRWGGVDFTIEGSYFDSRPERTADDIDSKEAEILGFIQSFRLIESVNDGEKNEPDHSP